MSSTDVSSAPSAEAGLSTIDMNLEVVQVPVSDVDRAKSFYERLGWRMDVDLGDGPARDVQFTPPHSGCSIQFGARTSAAPGSAQNTFLVVDDVDAAREDLVGRGIDVSDVEVASPPPGLDAQDERSYFATAAFSDPDGNSYVLQEVKNRIPGRTWED